jgi:hypothetical protein
MDQHLKKDWSMGSFFEQWCAPTLQFFARIFYLYIYICIYMNIVPRSCISHLPILNIHWERSLNAVIMQQVNQAACFVFEKWFKDDEPVRQQATPQG